ncbi:hypothetical protein [Paenibacillus sp. MMO-58]|uniref:hypothetical protein n=1 Tax=Paenibacillus sp. MMO-58 TaxID=3081290 RepID=UPI00301B6206
MKLLKNIEKNVRSKYFEFFYPLFILIAIIIANRASLLPPMLLKHLKISDDKDIVLAITGGILSLVGLVAIFVSLNVQQRIEKTREVYWSMIKEHKTEENPFELSKKIDALLFEYANVSHKESYIDSVITLFKAALAFIALSWSIYVGQMYPTMTVHILAWFVFFFGLIILLFFSMMFDRFKKPVEITELPSINNLLNVNFVLKNKIKIHTLLLAGTSLQITPILNLSKTGDTRNTMRISVAIPVNNYKLVFTSVEAICKVREKEDALNNSSGQLKNLFIDPNFSLNIDSSQEVHEEIVREWVHPFSLKKQVGWYHDFKVSEVATGENCFINDNEIVYPTGMKELRFKIKLIPLVNEKETREDIIELEYKYTGSFRGEPARSIDYYIFGRKTIYMRGLTQFESNHDEEVEDLMTIRINKNLSTVK